MFLVKQDLAGWFCLGYNTAYDIRFEAGSFLYQILPGYEPGPHGLKGATMQSDYLAHCRLLLR